MFQLRDWPPQAPERAVHKKNLRNQIRGKINNAQGFIFEDELKKACQFYWKQGRAKIDKTPEPFRVMKKHEKGLFTGRFTSPAQPDFQGTFDGGKSIVFEAKYTTADRMSRNVLTQNQMDVLEDHHRMGAAAFVVIGIQSRFFTIPWIYWRDMKKWYGRQYIKADDLGSWEIRFTGAVMFLDFVRTAMEGKATDEGRSG